MNTFKQATRNKLRFRTTSGLLSTEDLWDLPLESKRGPSLLGIATELQAELDQQPTTVLSFFKSTPTKDPVLEHKFEIVKEIVTTKVAENEAKSKEKAKETARAELDNLIAEKQKESIKSMSIEELQKMRDEL